MTKPTLKKRPNVGPRQGASLQERTAILNNPAVQEWADGAPIKQTAPDEPVNALDEAELPATPAHFIKQQKAKTDYAPATSIRMTHEALANIEYLLANLPGARSRNRLLERYILEGIERDKKRLMKK